MPTRNIADRAPVALLASPYATELVLLRTMLVGPALRTFIGECGPTRLALTAVFSLAASECGTARRTLEPADALRTIDVARDTRRRSDDDSRPCGSR